MILNQTMKHRISRPALALMLVISTVVLPVGMSRAFSDDEPARIANETGEVNKTEEVSKPVQKSEHGRAQAEAASSVQDIIKKWEARERRISSVRVTWIERRLDAKGWAEIVGRPPAVGENGGNGKPRPAFPPREATSTFEKFLALDGKKYRFEEHGTTEANEKGEPRSVSMIATFDGTETRSLRVSEALQITQGIKYGKRPDYHLNLLGDLRPLLWTCRPTHPRFELALAGMELSPATVEINGRECVCLEHVSKIRGFKTSIFVDMEHDAAIVRYLLTTLQGVEVRSVDMTYQEKQNEWVPISWQQVWRVPADGTFMFSMEADVTNIALNPELATSQFVIDFPPEARVFDQR